MLERKDFEVQRRKRSDEEPQRVEQRSEDGDHDKSVSKNGGNLKGRNRYGVSGRDRSALRPLFPGSSIPANHNDTSVGGQAEQHGRPLGRSGRGAGISDDRLYAPV